MKVLIINNLASGYREGSIYDFMRSFVEDGDEVCLRSSDGGTSIDSLLDDADSFDVVVASGGDGTIASVAYRLRNTGVPILPYPAGTANLLSLNLLGRNRVRLEEARFHDYGGRRLRCRDYGKRRAQ